MSRKSFFPVLICFTFCCQSGYSQSTSVSKSDFFHDTSVLHASLVTNLTKVFKDKKKAFHFPGKFITTLPDSSKVEDAIVVERRGHFRGGFCFIPPLRLKFSGKEGNHFYYLKTLKLVSECKISQEYGQYLLKEYLAYKIYNLICPMSFQVRLLDLHLIDSAGKKSSMNEYAFFLEDIKDVAARNKCKEWTRGKLATEQTNRRQMTMVSIFEFMIGNTDWAVIADHNTRLIHSLTDTLSMPYVIPYDFDYSGFVNAYYAVPDDRLEIEHVSDRIYRGFPRNMEELQGCLDTFRARKKDIYDLINHFNLLTLKSKEELIGFLNGFYEITDNPKMVKYYFIDKARTD